MFPMPLAFTYPFVLAALAGLPLLYFLLRITPPRPVLVPFPPLRLLLGLRPASETARHTPWWLLLLRLVIAACLIFAMAGPVLNPLAVETQAGPLLIVLDNGWPAAPSWEQTNFRGDAADRGRRAKFAARRRCRDIGGATRDPTPRCSQGARPFAGSQTCTLSSRPAAGSGGDH